MTAQAGIDYIGIAVVFFCYDHSGRCILALRSEHTRDEHHRWDIGGGALEHGNTILQQIQKEVREEYCTEVLNTTYLGYRNVLREHNGVQTQWFALDFAVHVNPTPVAIGEPEKCDAIQWATLGRLPQNLHSQLPHFLALYADRLHTILTAAHTSSIE